jgi:hypothetical protein
MTGAGQIARAVDRKSWPHSGVGMNRRILVALVAGSVALSYRGLVHGQPAASEPSGLTLALDLPSGPVLVDGNINPTCVIANLEPKRVEICVLVGGEQWTYHTSVGTVSRLVTSSATICKSEFALDPGEKHSWQTRVHAPDIATGTLQLELEILRGPRDIRGLYPPNFIRLASQPIPIEIVGTR